MFELEYKDLKLMIDVIIKRNNRRIYLKVIKPNIIRITTPINLDNSKILEFISKDYKFIKKHLDKIDLPKSNSLHLFGKEYNLILVNDKIDYSYNDMDNIYVHYKNEKHIKNIVSNFYNQMLKRYIDLNINKAKEDLNIKYNINIHYKDVKTYFGQCRPKTKDVVFSSRLAKYDNILILSVIYHELAHFYYLNHQDGFYNLLEKVFPNYKFYQKKLRSIRYNDYC